MPHLTDNLVEAAQERLREFDIALEMERSKPTDGIAAGDATVFLSRGNAKARYVAVVKSSMTLTALAREALTHPYPPLIISNHISRRSAAALRAAGIQFIDALGNASIEFGNVLVEVQGRTASSNRQQPSGDSVTRPSKSANLFSPRRAQVILALLTWQELRDATIRDIAAAAGVSTGQAHDALDQLEQAEFFLPSPRRLVRVNELLNYWTAAYPAGLGSKLQMAKYYGDPVTPIRPPDAAPPIYLSGECAKGTDIARPATLTLYIDVMHPLLPIVNRWTASPDRQPNVFIRRKFWSEPDADEERPSSKTRNAPWPLVYADLMATGDARLREVAGAWRAGHVGPDDLSSQSAAVGRGRRR